MILDLHVFDFFHKRLCSVWNLETAKCLKTFKHRAPISAVALSKTICISGCEAGKVKVWEILTGNLIKVGTFTFLSLLDILPTPFL